LVTIIYLVQDIGMFRCFHANKPSFLDHCMILHISHHVSRVFARQETAGFSEPCTHLSFMPLLSSISGTRLLSNQQIASKGCRRKLPTHLLVRVTFSHMQVSVAYRITGN